MLVVVLLKQSHASQSLNPELPIYFEYSYEDWRWCTSKLMAKLSSTLISYDASRLQRTVLGRPLQASDSTQWSR